MRAREVKQEIRLLQCDFLYRQHVKKGHPVCSIGLGSYYIVSYCIKWVTISWVYSIGAEIPHKKAFSSKALKCGSRSRAHIKYGAFQKSIGG